MNQEVPQNLNKKIYENPAQLGKPKVLTGNP